MKHLYLVLTFILMTATTYAQQPQNQQRQAFSPEQFQKRMESFVKEQAKLTDEEAQKFFPMLSEMQSKQRKNSQRIREQMMKGMQAKTDEDYEKILKSVSELEIQNKKLDDIYNKKFSTVISWKKIYSVRQAIEMYNMQALRHFTPQMGGFGGFGQGFGGFGQIPRGNNHNQQWQRNNGNHKNQGQPSPSPYWNNQNNGDNK